MRLSLLGVLCSAAAAQAQTRAIVIEPNPVTVSESGDATYTVRLSVRPAGSVFVYLSFPDDVTVSGSTSSSIEDDGLTFLPDNYDTPQTITIAGVDNDDEDGDRETDVFHEASSGAEVAWNSVNETLIITVTDDDAPPTPGLSTLRLVSPGDQTYARGATITELTLPAASGGVAPYSYDLSVSDGDLPAGLEISHDDASAPPALSGLPTTPGDATLTYSVNDADVPPHTVSVTFTVTVAGEIIDICARTPQIRDAILTAIDATDPLTGASLGVNTTCDTVTRHQLESLDRVEPPGMPESAGVFNFAELGVTSLRSGDFAGLTGVEILHLDENQISSLPEDIFAGLSGLEELYLSVNQLSSLPSDVFAGLDDLIALYLDGNQLTGLPADVFDGLNNLEELYLNVNRLTELEENLLSGLGALVFLRLDDNPLIRLRPGDLPALPASDLGIDLTPVGTIAPRVLETLATADVDVSDQFISNAFLTGARDLSYSVTSSDASVADATVSGSVVTLNAAAPGATIVTVTASDSESTAIQEIEVRVTPAPLTLAAAIVVPAATVGESYTFTPPAARGGTAPYTYLLIPTTGALPSGLSVSGNGGAAPPLLSGTPARAGTVNLSYRVSDSSIPTLFVSPTPTFDLTVVSPVVNICGRTTQVIAGIRNAIPGRPACDAVTEEQLASIDELSLSGRSITSLQADDFAGLTRLATLRLNNNNFSSLPPGIFDDLRVLENLILFDTQLGRVETVGDATVSWSPPADLFSGTPSLTQLYMHNNQLTRLPAGLLSHTPFLQIVYFNGNQLTNLSVGIFDGLPVLTGPLGTLQLHNNPFDRLPHGAIPSTQGNLTLDPTAVGTIAPQTLVVGGGTREVRLKPAFIFRTEDDAAGDGIRFPDASSSDPSVVRVNNMDVRQSGRLRLVPEGPGTAVITARAATRGMPGANDVVATQQIMVTVLPASAPAVTLPFPGDQTYTRGVEIERLDMQVASGGTAPYTYTLQPLTGALPEGLRINRRMGDLSRAPRVAGTPTEPGVVHLSYSVVDSSSPPVTAHATEGIPGTLLHRAHFTITVEDSTTSICDRTPQVEARILAEIGGGVTCGSVTAGQLAALDELRISSRGIDTLQVGDFAGLTNINSLNLDGNDLETLPVDVFADLISLRELNVENNNLRTLPVGVFNGLDSLRELYLADNPLTTLPEGIFAGLNNLSDLGLAETSLGMGELPANIFAGLDVLNVLRMAVAQLTTLPEGIFDGLSRLNHLELQSNPFTRIPPGVIPSPVPNIFVIDLAPVGEIAPQTVTAGGSVAVYVGDSFISSMQVGGLRTLSFDATSSAPTIVTPTVSGGGVTLTAVAPGDATVTVSSTDRGKTATQEITVTVTETSVDICARSAAVRDAILATIGGGVTCDAVPGSALTALTTLDLSSQSIDSLRASDFANLAGLTELHLSDAGLSGLSSDVFTNLVNLATLDLSANQLGSLPSDLFDGLIALTTLRLDDNQLSSLPSTVFDRLGSLEHLRLEGNRLSTLPAGVFSDLGNLARLRLDDNRLSGVSANVFTGLTGLESLDLRDNQLTTLPGAVFAALTSLGRLDLSGNPFTQLPVDALPSSLPNLGIDLTPLGQLAPLTLTPLSALDVSVAEAFVSSDITGGERALTYAAASNDANVATATFTDAGVGLVTVTAVAAGRAAVTVTANDGRTAATRNIDVTVARPLAFAAAVADQTYLAGQAIAPLPLPVAENGAAPYRYQLAEENLPDGLSVINNDAATPPTLSGRPTEATDASGVVIDYTVHDARDASASLTFTLTVLPPEVTLRFAAADYALIESEGTVDVEITLSARPYREVAVPLTVAGTATNVDDYTLSATAVTFSASASGDALRQTITATGVSDSVSDVGETVILGFGALPARVSLAPAPAPTTATITIADDDNPGLSVAPTTLTLSEDGGAGEYTVRLNTEPTDDVTVTVSGDASAATVSPETLTFTDGDWETPQTVTVTGVDDDLDNPGDQRVVVISHDASGGGYSGLAEAQRPAVTVTVSDDDAPLLIFADDATIADQIYTVGQNIPILRLPEAQGGAAPLTYALSGAPDGLDFDPATRELSGTPTTAVDATPVVYTVSDAASASASLTFTITVTPALSLRNVAAQTAVAGQSFSLTLPAARGGIAPYTYTLTGLPDGLAFDDDPATRAVSGVPTTAADATTVTYTVTDSATPSAGMTELTFMLTVDVPAVTLNFGAASYPLNEDGAVDVAVTLSARPYRDVTVQLSTSGSATNVDDYTLSASSLIFAADASAADLTQTVTVTGVDDSIVDPGESVTLQFDSLPARVTAGATATTTVTITDNDVPGLTIAPQTITIAEAGGATTYTVILSVDPSGSTVTVRPMSVDASIATVAPETLTFTSADYSVAQTVTVSGVDDAIDNAGDARSVQITHRVGDSESGGLYAALDEAQRPPVTVTVSDDDTAGFQISATALTVEESAGRNTATYTLRLSSEPTADVTVTPMSGATGIATVSDALTFSADNWDTPQTVTVTGVDDGVAAGARDATITHTVSGGGYGAVAAPEVAVTVNDDDVALPVVTITAATDEIDEGEDAVFTLARSVTGSELTVRVRVVGVSVRFVGAPPDMVRFAAADGTTTLTVKTDDDDDAQPGRRAVLAEIVNDAAYEVDADAGNDGIAVRDDDEDAGDQVQVTLLDVGNDPAALSAGRDASLSTPGGVEVRLKIEDDLPPSLALTRVTVNPATFANDVTRVDITFDAVDATIPEQYRDTSVSAREDYSYVDIDVAHFDDGGDESMPRAGDTEVCLPVAAALRAASNAASPVRALELLHFDGDSWNVEDSVDLGSLVCGGVAEFSPFALGLAPAAAATPSLSFDAAVDARTATAGESVTAWTLPAASGGSAPYTYTLTGLPMGLTFDDDAGARAVTGAPREAGSFALVYTATDASDASVSQMFTLTVNAPAVTVMFGAAAYSVDENGGTAEVVIALSAQPYREVPVTLTVGGGATRTTDYTLSATSVTFAADDTSAAVTVLGVDDGDSDPGETVVLGFSALPAGVTAAAPETATVTITDDDTAGLRITPTTVTVAEAGGDATYSVSLSATPSGSSTVTVTPTSGDASIATVSPAALTFTSADYNVAQTVTVTGVDDDVDNPGGARSVRIAHAVSDSETGGDYAMLDEAQRPSVTVTVSDDDTAGLEVSASALTVDEAGGGNTATYTVNLASAPTGDVTVTPVSNDASIATASEALTFTTENWDTPQTVTVTGVDDDVVSGARSTTVRHEFAGGGYDAVTAPSVAVTVGDDDVAGLQFSETAVTVAEAGAGNTATYTVRLEAEPGGEVTVTPASGNTGIATVSDALTFTTENWDTPQTVTVTGVDDDVDNAGDARDATISHTARGGGYDALDATPATLMVRVTVTDDDVAGLRISLSSFTVNEGGTAEYTVALATQPLANVAVDVSVSGDGDISVEPATLTFTGADWNAPQTVTVSAAEDGDSDSGSATISHAPTGDAQYSALGARTLAVTENDNDAPGLQVSETTLTVAEAGGTATYTVSLSTDPSGSVVTVTPTSGDASIATASPASLRFTTADWSAPQTVTVTGVNDDLDNPGGARTVSIAHTVADSDSGGAYATLPDAQRPPVAVTVTDDDSAGVQVSATAVTVSEAGGAASYTVRLAAAPTGDVRVTPESNDASIATVAPAALTFTTTNWQTPQTVTVTGVDDDLANAGGARTATVTHGVSGGGYDALNAPSVTVTVNDDDMAGVQVSTTTLTVNENGGEETETYTVRLDSAPTDAVTVTLTTSGDTDAATVAPTTLTFTTLNWRTPQTVTVTGVNDDTAGGARTVTVAHTVSGGGYDGLTVPSVTVTVDDDDTAGLQFSTTALTVDEAGGEAEYTLYLSSEPTGAVTVTLTTSGDTDAATVAPTTLAFTTSNWQTRQTVTVTGVDDDVDNPGDERTVTITHTASGGDYNGLTASVMVTVRDDDTSGLSEARRREAHEKNVGALSRGGALNAVNIISKRLRASARPAPDAQPSARPTMNLGGYSLERLKSLAPSDWAQQDWQRRVYDGMQSLHRDGKLLDTDFDFNLKRALRNSDFLLPLDDRGVTLWGTAGYTGFKGKPGDLDYSGDVVSGMIGVDGVTHTGLRLGLSLGYSEGGLDYDVGGVEAGEVEQKALTAHPYLSWTSPRGLSLWLMGGYGHGKYDVSKDAGAARADGLNARHYMAAGGVEQSFVSAAGFDMALRGKGLWSGADVDGGTFSDGAVMPALSSGNWRLALENEIGARKRFFDGDLRPYALVGARLDGGDVNDNNVSFDAGSGFAWEGRHFSMDLSLRAQINGGDTRERSVVGYGGVRYAARHDGRGLHVSLKHGVQGGGNSSWDAHDFDGDQRKLLSWRPVMETEIGYGWALRPLSLARAGVLKTYSRARFSNAERRHALGLGFAFGTLNLSLESGYKERGNTEDGAKNGGIDALLKGELKF